jgi:hypothetical protein
MGSIDDVFRERFDERLFQAYHGLFIRFLGKWQGGYAAREVGAGLPVTLAHWQFSTGKWRGDP